ncbi:MAG: tail fiber domain-containing protein [Flavobacteriales bacterium]|nr:tail fiber domain-containing protein [Flavobacteriales bacterium]
MATGTGGSEDALDIYGVHGGAAPGGGTTRRADGVMGLVSAQGTGAVTNAYGVHGSVTNTDPATTFRAGVYGTSPVVYTDTNSTGALGSWAGYCQGMVRISSNAYVNGNVLVTSDASLKTNVEDITNARELMSALQPKSYEFIPQQHPHMQMPPGRQFGLDGPRGAGGSAGTGGTGSYSSGIRYHRHDGGRSHQPLGHQLQRFHSGIDRGGKGAASDHF